MGLLFLISCAKYLIELSKNLYINYSARGITFFLKKAIVTVT